MLFSAEEVECHGVGSAGRIYAEGHDPRVGGGGREREGEEEEEEEE